MPVGLLEASRPQLGDAEVDQRQHPQVPAQPELRWAGGLGGGQQPLRLLGHGRDVAALAGQPHAHDGEYHLRALTPADGHRVQSPGGQSQIPFGLLQRPPGQLVPGHPRGQLRVRRDHAGREPGQELVRGSAQSVEPEAGPVVRQHAGGQAPVPGRLGVADRLDQVPVFRVLAALLLAGRSSDQAGRKPVLAVALGASALSTVVFILAPDVGVLLAGRIVSGLSAGLMTGTATARASIARASTARASTARASTARALASDPEATR